MYYNRTLSASFSRLLEKGGELRWLFDFVVQHDYLDFQIGKSKTKEWISVYCGLTRLFSIKKLKDSFIFIDTADKYQKLSQGLYGKKEPSQCFKNEIETLISEIQKDKAFDRYYQIGKEGYFQNEFSRRFGILGRPDDDFVIIDKEAVIGFKDKDEKAFIFGSIQERYKQIQCEVSENNPQRFGKGLQKKSIGNELDFLALDKDGNVLLIEFKHRTNTSGIYLSPLQIGLYFDIFSVLPRKDLEDCVFDMLEQKQRIGLINLSWKKPERIKDIIPVLIISDFNNRSIAKKNFYAVLEIIRRKYDNSFLNSLQVLTINSGDKLQEW